MTNSNQYWSICLYPFFLSSLSSCTFVSYTDEELENELAILAQKAIARFKFPKVSLAYEFNHVDPETPTPKPEGSIMPIPEQAGTVDGWYFIEEVTMREIIVIVA